MTWLILFAPLVSAVLITFLLHPMKKVSVGVSIAACAVSFIGALCVFFSAPDAAPDPAYAWIDIPIINGMPGLNVIMGTVTDPLARLMLLVVTGVGLCVHVFSYGYMEKDPSISRFFAKLSLFMFSMLGIVLASNLVMMFIFWELVGLSSYLLIGFWFQRPSAAEASKKAFIVNRIGDFGFLLGIIGVWWIWGTVDFNNLETGVASDLANGFPPWVTPVILHLVTFGLFMGCMGKSAQFPLHVWLPESMEGPTPVSALIHAATMVAAGVYMLCRIIYILELSPLTMLLIASIGALTALFTGLIAIQQDDIKRVLAYSTLSQLGYMVLAVGVAAPGAAMWHLTTHACFKALLFLGAGSVIHAMHDEQDIWKMGGLRRHAPWTFWTFLVGYAALIAVPFTSGFFSKESILGAAFEKFPILGWVGVVAAGVTAFYMTRLVLVTFFGEGRTEAARHGHESPWHMLLPLVILAFFSIATGYVHIPDFIGFPLAEEHGHAVMIASLTALVLGAGAGVILYRNAEKDPLNIEILRNKFYSDEIYLFFFVGGQQLLARFLAFVDRWIVDGLVVRGSSVAANISGEVLRLVQGGNVQAYLFVFILGVLALFGWMLQVLLKWNLL
jgi:NADH-quinone oxidoreductase subunit L